MYKLKLLDPIVEYIYNVYIRDIVNIIILQLFYLKYV